MVRRVILAVVLAAGMLLGVLTAPAHASVLDKVCDNPATWVHLYAYYEPVTISAGRGNVAIGKRWTHFTYRLGYSDPIGDQNNVNIRLYGNGDRIYEYKSPDNRVRGRWYTVVVTSKNLVTSNFNTNDIVFEGIFDLRGLPDIKKKCAFGGV